MKNEKMKLKKIGKKIFKKKSLQIKENLIDVVCSCL